MVRINCTVLLLTADFLFVNGFHVSLRPKYDSSSRLLVLPPNHITDKPASPVAKEAAVEKPPSVSSRIERSANVTVIVGPNRHAAVKRPPASSRISTQAVSRRDWLRIGAVIAGGVIVGGATAKHSFVDQNQQLHDLLLPKKLAPVNFTKAAIETSINVTLDYPKTLVTLDHKTFQKVRTVKLPEWVPSYFVPRPVVCRDMTNTELLVAATVAGSAVEMARTSMLYPLSTLKTRIQADTNYYKRNRRTVSLKRSWQVLQLNARKHWREGQLYAGIVPSLLVSVPATGVYYGVRDVVKRALNPTTMSDLTIAISAALVADVVSLVIRTPADALAVRLQVATGESSHDDVTGNHTDVEAIVGNWFIESIERLPAIIVTDLPFLLSKIILRRIVFPEGIDIGRYEIASISTALLCAFLTTPFDVARTRLLVDSDDDPSNGIDGGLGGGLTLRTFQTIANEGDGGIRNLYAGWLERTAYLGVGRAWIEPLQLLGYMWIRDAILLEWYD
jgi:hypothetical protein